MNEYHKPVLLEESIEGLNIDDKKSQVFVDLTYGGGGHSSLILERMSKNSRLFAFDQDVEAIENEIKDERLILLETNFRYFNKFLRLFEVSGVDGILADLGVSSHQFDDGKRGFSYRADEKLDMRMNQKQKKDAIVVLNEYSENELVKVFSKYGEIRNSKQLARKIAQYRQRFVIESTGNLMECIEDVIRGNKIKYLSQLFQAIRIEVNDEIGVLTEMLNNTKMALKSGGRLVAMSYHSLEDRLVKNLIKRGNAEGIIHKNEFGHIDRPFKEVYKGIITAERDEIESNPRARSAKLRIAEKI